MIAFQFFRIGVALSQLENRMANIRTLDIVKAVCKYYELQLDDLTGSYKPRRIGYARNVAIYVLKNNTSMTYEAIGDLFGITNSSAAKAYATVSRNRDPRVLEEVSDLEDMVKTLILAEYNEEIPF